MAHPPPMEQQSPGHIDPNLFSLYTTEGDSEPSYYETHYQPEFSYPTTEHMQGYDQQQASANAYGFPSLEEIANEVLVDLSGPDPNDKQSTLETAMQAYQHASNSPMANGHPKPDESVDSAISLPTTESVEQHGLPNGHDMDVADNVAAFNEFIVPDPPSETNGARPVSSARSEARPQSSASKSGAATLALYQPPAPLSQSPEVAKKQHVLANGNGVAHGSPPAEAGVKRKRESATTPSAKKARLDLQGGAEQAVADEEQESLELARILAQQDRGLRRRS